MRKILVIVGSGIKNGNTDKLADAYKKGAEAAGNEITKVFLGDKEIAGCRGCGACQNGKHICAIDDVMQEIYPLLEECDTVVLASPLYFWSISARTKAFIDRLYAISTDDKYPHKNSVLLITAGDDQFWTFEQPVSYYRFVTKAIGWTDIGMYLAGGCNGEAGKRHISEKHLEGAYLLGSTM